MDSSLPAGEKKARPGGAGRAGESKRTENRSGFLVGFLLRRLRGRGFFGCGLRRGGGGGGFAEREANHQALVEQAGAFTGDFLGAVDDEAVFFIGVLADRDVFLGLAEAGFLFEAPLAAGPGTEDAGGVGVDVLDAFQLAVGRTE